MHGTCQCVWTLMHVWRGQPARRSSSTESCALHVCMYDLGEFGEVMSEVTEQSQKPPEAISEHVHFWGHAPRPPYIVMFHIPSLPEYNKNSRYVPAASSSAEVFE